MSAFKIWLSTPHLSGRELYYIEDALNKNWVSTAGENIVNFEEDLEKYLNQNLAEKSHKHVLALNSGTTALHLALILLGIKEGDYVICQDLTFVATVNPITYLGASPVFVDSEKLTWNMSPALLKEAIEGCISKGKMPKAIITVDLYGMPAQYDQLINIAREYDIPLIEDAAESLGSSFYGQECGSFGDMALLSFAGNKIITTSGGGALITSTIEDKTRANFLSTQAKDPASHYQHSHIGYNYKLSNILAGIGRGQMEVLEDRIEARRKNNRFYQEELGNIPGIYVHKEPSSAFYSNHWLSCILIDPIITNGIDREYVRKELANKDIEARPMWKPMHLQPVFENYDFYGDGTGEELFDKGLCLPSGSNLSLEQLREITDIIKSCFTVKA